MARVKELRLANGLTQEQFAERAGLDYKYYQHVEAGRRPNLGLDTLLKIARGADMDLWRLLHFDRDLPAVAYSKDDELTVTPRKGAGKVARRTAGQTRR
ncbi:MAG TPA: helix-turn-helix transcriptional regulator [Lacunisphaera sp.]|jgi:transcriptional regulator with XRE-family HTH domain|nr:helix-turn-helix transcriptional regulator [Lacunisphaera sp.]HQY05805.1 helix-turn-helix transcriptional regulator [Lacunisphaera sp.]